jgi:parallel beta-helix repeat protein
VKNSEDIVIENNKLLKNKIGVFAYRTNRLKILNNDIRETQVVGSLKCEYCEDSEIAYNYLLDNGRPDWFWVPGNRIIGIWIAASNNMDIHDNTVIRSSSDGIGISGHIDSSLEEPGKVDWTITSENIRVYNNVLLDNLELGIWLARIRNMECYNNTIRDHYAPIDLDFDIRDSEFYDNKLVSWGGPPISVGAAKNNYIHDNIWYVTKYEEFIEPKGEDSEVNLIKFEWSNIEPYDASGNVFKDNQVYEIGGKLKEALLAKKERERAEGIFELKGFFACEIEEGLFDEECVERENAKGNQGMPKDLFVYEPLMENFEEFVISSNTADESTIKQNTYNDNKKKANMTNTDTGDEEIQGIAAINNCEKCDYTKEKVYAFLFFITFSLLILIAILYMRKKG